jgi:drug/metabolite transporter (DMT)-like permease
MTARTEGLALVVALLVISFVFQIQLKLLAGEVSVAVANAGPSSGDRLRLALDLLFSWRVVFVATMAAGLFAIWLMTLMRLDLSLALPLASVALAVNAIGGGMVLGEPLTWSRAAGIGIIALGVGLVLTG